MPSRPHKPPFYRAPKPVPTTQLASSQRFSPSANKAGEAKLMKMATEYLVLCKSPVMGDFRKSTELINQMYGLFGHSRTDMAISKMRKTLKVMTL